MTGQFEFHPLANLFPLLEGDEFDGLVADVRAKGLREPIVLYDGKILDGRNRYRACLAAGREPDTVPFDISPCGNIGPVDYVLSANLMRRHLTVQQRAAIAAELATMKSGTRTDLASNASRSGMSDAQAAKALKVSEPSVERAKKRMREDPAAHEQAKRGTLPRKPPTPAAASPERQQAAREAMQVRANSILGTAASKPDLKLVNDGRLRVCGTADAAQPEARPLAEPAGPVDQPQPIYPTFEEVRSLYDGDDAAFAKWFTGHTKMTVDQLKNDLEHGSLPYARLRDLQVMAKRKGITFRGPAEQTVEPESEGDDEDDGLGLPPSKRQPSRPKRWADACARASEALSDLQELQEEYRDWHAGLPENLQGGAIAEKLETIDGIDFESAMSTIDEAEGADLPLGFGRD